MAEPRFEPHATALQAVHAAAANDNAEDTRRAPRLVVVAFLDRWSPPALATATALEAVRNSGDVNAFAHIFLVDATTERDAAWDGGVVVTPALQFYWNGELALVRRPGWEDDNKFVGAAAPDKLVEIIRHARDCCAVESAQPVIGLDF